MRGIHALVAEVPVDLEDPLDAADDAALQVQLGSDAQVEVYVEGVGAGDEGARRRPAVQRLQHRGLDLDEIQAGEVLAHRRDDLDAGHRVLARRGAHDQVRVAVANALLLVHLGERDRQRAQRLRRHLPRRRHHRKFAAFRRDHAPSHRHNVAEVDVVLPARQRIGADLGEREHDLQLGAVALLQGREAQLTGVALEHDAPGDGDHILGFLTRAQGSHALRRGVFIVLGHDDIS